MLDRSPVAIKSVEPSEGAEGTIVTLRGSGFASHVRNNCVVMGGMGACARAQPGATDSELKVRIGPVASEHAGEVLMWTGVGLDIHTDRLSARSVNMDFSEVAIFRNGTEVASSGVEFRLTKASPHTFGAYFERKAPGGIELSGHEQGAVMRARFPARPEFPMNKVDVCIVLKEPTVAIDFVANLSGCGEDIEACLNAIAKGISVHAGIVGERVIATVGRDERSGNLYLYVTKPYLQNGMLTIHFVV